MSDDWQPSPSSEADLDFLSSEASMTPSSSLARLEDDEVCLPYIPERGLLAAVLERAFRDLNPEIDRVYRRTAISWFKASMLPKGRRGRNEGLIPFWYIAQTLGLGEMELRVLLKKVEAAEKQDG